MNRIYLDHHATSPLRPEAARVMGAALDAWGNPSSIHGEGRRARALVDAGRAQTAAWLGVDTSDLIFTSGGTEANRIALEGHTVWATRAEHPSVTAWVQEARLIRWHGAVWDLAQLGANVGGADIVAVSAVNHETGVRAPLAELAEVVRRAGARLHVDAVAAAGRVGWNEIVPFADSITVSAHKIGGPMGVGALWLRPGGACPIGFGGGQERGRRAGTENVMGIAGFGAAAAASTPWSWEPELAMAPLIDVVREYGGRIHGAEVPKIPATLNVGFPGIRGDTLVMALDLLGVAVSAGSACSSGTPAPSPVLSAMGLAPDEARQAVRISGGYCTTAAEIATAAGHLRAAVARAYQVAQGAA